MADDVLFTVLDSSWSPEVALDAPTTEAEEVIEGGCVLHLPALSFALTDAETTLVRGAKVRSAAKNISMRWRTNDVRGQLRGAQGAPADLALVTAMLERFSQSCMQLVGRLFPTYRCRVQRGNASFRPTPLEGRATSWRQDDSRLHIDAFPSNPLGGVRLLRVFTNIDPDGAPRVWRLGEPFPDLVDRYHARIRQPLPGSAWLLHRLGITKRRRSLYDHVMLQLHDLAKADSAFQRDSPQRTVTFAPGASWVVFSDQVLHAAMSGRNLLEHTFLLDPAHQKYPHSAPLAVLHRKLDGWNTPRPPRDHGEPQHWWPSLTEREGAVHDDR